MKRRKDGRYVLSATIGGRRRWFYGRTLAEARKKLLKALDDSLKPPDPEPEPPPEPTLWDWLVADLGTGRLAPTTWADRAYLLRRHLAPRPEAQKPLSKLTPGDVAAVVGSVSGPSRAAKLFGVLRAALNRAVRAGLIPENPALKAFRPREPRPRRRYLNEAEAKALAAELIRDGGRWAAFFGLALGCGLRRSELLGLEWADLDLEAGLLRVRRAAVYVGGKLVIKEPKSPSAERLVAMPGWVKGLLAGLGPGEGPVFGPVTTPVIYRRLQAYCQRAKVPYVGLHGLRHSMASLALLGGAPLPEVARALGHANPAITALLYAHSVGSARVVARALEGLGSGP